MPNASTVPDPSAEAGAPADRLPQWLAWVGFAALACVAWRLLAGPLANVVGVVVFAGIERTLASLGCPSLLAPGTGDVAGPFTCAVGAIPERWFLGHLPPLRWWADTFMPYPAVAPRGTTFGSQWAVFRMLASGLVVTFTMHVTTRACVGLARVGRRALAPALPGGR